MGEESAVCRFFSIGVGYAIIKGKNGIKLTFSPTKKVNPNLPQYEQMPCGGGVRSGVRKHLWDSPTEQTDEKGGAVGSDKGSTARYAG